MYFITDLPAVFFPAQFQDLNVKKHVGPLQCIHFAANVENVWRARHDTLHDHEGVPDSIFAQKWRNKPICKCSEATFKQYSTLLLILQNRIVEWVPSSRRPKESPAKSARTPSWPDEDHLLAPFTSNTEELFISDFWLLITEASMRISYLMSQPQSTFHEPMTYYHNLLIS